MRTRFKGLTPSPTHYQANFPICDMVSEAFNKIMNILKCRYLFFKFIGVVENVFLRTIVNLYTINTKLKIPWI